MVPASISATAASDLAKMETLIEGVRKKLDA